MIRHADPAGSSLPPLTIGTFEYRGQVFLRATHLVDWLEGAIDQLDPIDAAGARDIASDIAETIAAAGDVRRG